MLTANFLKRGFGSRAAIRGGAFLLLIPSLSVLALAKGPEAPGDGTVRAVEIQRAIPAGAPTMLSIQTTPAAVCMLHPEGVNDAKHRLRLDADDDGMVRVHATSKSVSSAALPMLLDCTAGNGRKTTYPVELRAQQAAPGVPVPEPRLSAKGIARPQLQGDPAKLTNQELIAHGYPPRPDPAAAPGAYAKWLTIVSRPFTQVSSRRVAHPEIRHNLPTRNSPTLPIPPPSRKFSSSLNFGNWSGAYMTNPDVKYWDVQADWLIPAVQDVPWYLGYAAAAEWVGLDNAGNDLVQSGSDSEAFYYSFFGQDWTFTNYSVWVESLPDSPYYLPNFPASPGDQLSVSVFLADQNGSTSFYYGDLTPSDDTVWFMIYNLTTGNSYWGTLPKPAAFSGSTVDFIIEAPNVNGGTTNLADFGVAGMHDCWFADSWFGYSSLDYDGSDPNVGTLYDVTMFNGGSGNTLASSYIYANYSQPGGGNIFWVWQNYN